jgi:hypothetical protein
MKIDGKWPDYVMLRDTGLHDDQGGLGQRIYTTAGAGYVKEKYVRAARSEPAAEMPEDPDETVIEAIREAWRNTRTHGVSGMTIDAQWRAEYTREFAVYRAIRAALTASPKPGTQEAGDA